MTLHTATIGPVEAARIAAIKHHRQRIYGAARRQVAVLVSIPKPAPVEVLPEWTRQDTFFNAHVVLWKSRWRVSAKTWLFRRCKQIGVEYGEVIGPARNTQIVAIRRGLIWECEQAYPGISLPELGRTFMRDHATIHHAKRQTLRLPPEKRSAEGLDKPLRGQDPLPRDPMLIGQHYCGGTPQNAIMARFRIGRTTIEKLVKQYGWERPKA